jgi:hypothetical protein
MVQGAPRAPKEIPNRWCLPERGMLIALSGLIRQRFSGKRLLSGKIPSVACPKQRLCPWATAAGFLPEL